MSLKWRHFFVQYCGICLNHIWKKTKVASYDWTSDLQKLMNTTIDNWPMLNEVERQNFIQIAKKGVCKS
jgi:hypothetical protein